MNGKANWTEKTTNIFIYTFYSAITIADKKLNQEPTKQIIFALACPSLKQYSAVKIMSQIKKSLQNSGEKSMMWQCLTTRPLWAQ